MKQTVTTDAVLHHPECPSFTYVGGYCTCAGLHARDRMDKHILETGAIMGNGDKIITGLQEAIEQAKEINKGLDTVASVLEDRASSYGDYAAKAVTVQALKGIIRRTPNWDNMAPAFQESMDMFCSKMGRLLHGDPEHVDGWLDIEGYARLARRMVE